MDANRTGGTQMWTRTELKSNAKAALKNNYWECLAAYIIVIIINGAAACLGAIFPVLNFFISMASVFFLGFPLTVGLYFFFRGNRIAPPNMRNIFYAFDGTRYMQIVGTMAWSYLFLYLWSLIPTAGIVFGAAKFGFDTALNYYPAHIMNLPGSAVVLIMCGIIFIAGYIIVIIKAISYSMTAFILTDNPHIGYDRALKLSIAMTYGHKWRIFVLGLSFLGWYILGFLALIVGLIFLTPYIMATYTELYLKLRGEAIKNGLCTPEELNIPNELF